MLISNIQKDTDIRLKCAGYTPIPKWQIFKNRCMVWGRYQRDRSNWEVKWSVLQSLWTSHCQTLSCQLAPQTTFHDRDAKQPSLLCGTNKQTLPQMWLWTKQTPNSNQTWQTA
jgi:hypothetical protein